MVNIKPYFSVGAATLTMCLAGCGGGDSTAGGEFINATSTSSTATTATPEGLYAGIASNGRYFNTLVLENNQYYILYGGVAGDSFGVAGLITGTGQSVNGSFTSADAREFPALGVPILGTLSGSYVSGASFSAVLTTRGTAVTYAGTSSALATYAYHTRARLEDIAGVWNLFTAAGIPATLTISSTGTYTGTSAGCDFSGTFTPRASGKNVFDVTIRFGPSPCLLADQVATGHAVSYLLRDGKRQLLVAGSDVTRSVATVLAGLR
ncbi:hypothetical protein EDC30_102379 [Paucimonas lemoignei]|uniref:Uncharacterized protein n=1 Tax=Paucimonas lemoignei TaxID=29443 RepID=A0A4V2UJ46_PAULE|nr:hypothetical protein [Paucimonas lemoignei]TCS38640.1 hypothetical protein EDC30_102379 [Paucimonas lemoignei]